MAGKAEKQKAKVVYSGNGWSLLSVPGSKNYYVVAHIAGKPRLYASTRKSHIGEAKAVAKRLYTDYLLQEIADEAQQKTIDEPKIGEDFWSKYIALERAKFITGEHGEETFRRKENIWKRIGYYWAALEAKDFTLNNYTLFCADFELKNPGCSFQNEHKYLQALFNFMYSNGFLERKVMLPLAKNKAKPIEAREIITDEECRAILHALNTMNHPSESAEIRRQVLIRCGLYMGMRISEVAKMLRKNIYFRDEVWWLKLEDTKTDEPRTIAISDEALPWILKAQERGTEAYVFPNARNPTKPIPEQTLDKDWHVIFLKAGVTNTVFHEFKHTFTSRAIRAGHSLAHISQYVGTSVQVLVETYIHTKPEDTINLKKVMEFIK